MDATDRYLAVYWRYTTLANAYSVVVHWNASTDTSDAWYIARIDAGVATIMATGSTTLTAGTPFDVIIEDDGTTISVEVDGDMISITDMTHSGNTKQALLVIGDNFDHEYPSFDSILITIL